jgi:hypothetical protein
VAVICVELTTLTPVAAIAPAPAPLPWPITTVSPWTNPLPVIVIDVPPLTGPELGDTMKTAVRTAADAAELAHVHPRASLAVTMERRACLALLASA